MRTDLNLKLIERAHGESKRALETRVTVPALVNLPEIVEGNIDGERWLRRLRAETNVESYLQSEVIELYPGVLEASLVYVLTPRDGCEGGVYGMPSGDIDVKRLNGELAILNVGPSEEDIGGVRFLRRGVIVGEGIFDSYGLVPPTDGSSTPLTYLVGKLRDSDFIEFYHGSSGTFPIRHFLEVVYPGENEREMAVRIE